ncbi:hypothetical protein KY309_00665, partial [Candidatus Woesearchaeota archaeon]|nr:hypothetical protein [Candidatus Woesearchaeota archaeon]
GECGAGNTQEAVWYILEPVKEQPSAPAGTPLTEAQAWHVYQCMNPLYYGKNQDGTSINIGLYTTTFGECGLSNQVPNQYDSGYLLKQSRTGTGAIRYCQHQYGQYVVQIITETDIKFNANCDYDDRILTTAGSTGPNGVTQTILGYAFSTQQPGASQKYKCVKSGLPVRYNFRISSSPTCNAGQPGWDGYQNAGSLGWWLDQPVLPAGIQ